MKTIARAAFAMALGSTALAQAAPVAVPEKLAAASGVAGLAVEVAPDAMGVVDRSGGATLRLSRAAFDAATSDDERLVLMSMSLSYKVGARDARGPLDTGIGRVVSGVIAAAVEDGVATRDRRDPYLQLPTQARTKSRLTESARSTEPLALRGLAWAKAAGVCEATAVAYLDRLSGLRADDATIASDARALRRGLGMIAYAPGNGCAG